jgi:hypothetical protein
MLMRMYEHTRGVESLAFALGGVNNIPIISLELDDDDLTDDI